MNLAVSEIRELATAGKLTANDLLRLSNSIRFALDHLPETYLRAKAEDALVDAGLALMFYMDEVEK